MLAHKDEWQLVEKPLDFHVVAKKWNEAIIIEELAYVAYARSNPDDALLPSGGRVGTPSETVKWTEKGHTERKTASKSKSEIRSHIRDSAPQALSPAREPANMDVAHDSSSGDSDPWRDEGSNPETAKDAASDVERRPEEVAGEFLMIQGETTFPGFDKLALRWEEKEETCRISLGHGREHGCWSVFKDDLHICWDTQNRGARDDCLKMSLFRRVYNARYEYESYLVNGKNHPTIYLRRLEFMELESPLSNIEVMIREEREAHEFRQFHFPWAEVGHPWDPAVDPGDALFNMDIPTFIPVVIYKYAVNADWTICTSDGMALIHELHKLHEAGHVPLLPSGALMMVPPRVFRQVEEFAEVNLPLTDKYVVFTPNLRSLVDEASKRASRVLGRATKIAIMHANIPIEHPAGTLKTVRRIVRKSGTPEVTTALSCPREGQDTESNMEELKAAYEEVITRLGIKGDEQAAKVMTKWLTSDKNEEKTRERMMRYWEMSREDALTIVRWINKGLELKVIPRRWIDGPRPSETKAAGSAHLNAATEGSDQTAATGLPRGRNTIRSMEAYLESLTATPRCVCQRTRCKSGKKWFPTCCTHCPGGTHTEYCNNRERMRWQLVAGHQWRCQEAGEGASSVPSANVAPAVASSGADQ